jgi:hypothetical protein
MRANSMLKKYLFLAYLLIPTSLLSYTPILRAETLLNLTSGNSSLNPPEPQFSQNLKILELLPYESIKMGVNNLCAQGNVLGMIEGSRKNISVFQEYSKYRLNTDNSKLKTGIRVRLNVELLNIKSNLNLASLIGIGIAASTGKVKGKLNVEVLGISGSAITNALPLPAELSEESIIDALQAISNIKSRIYDKDVVITEKPLTEECSCQGNSCPIIN